MVQPRTSPSPRSKIKQAVASAPRRRTKTPWIIASVLVLTVAAGAAYYELVYVTANAVTMPTMQTTVAREGTLVISAGGTGTLVSKDAVDLAFQSSGNVTQVNVKVGDQVQKGDLLAQVDNTDLKLAYTQAKRALDELTSPSAIAQAEAAAATAQSDLDMAVQHLSYIVSPTVLHWENKVSEAQQALACAQSTATASSSDRRRRKS